MWKEAVGVLVLCVSLAGCGKSERLNVAGAIAYHIGEAGGGRIDYTVTTLSRNGRAFFILVAEGGDSSRPFGAPADGRPFHATLTAIDGRKVRWEYDPSKGRTDRVDIGDDSFELERGGVFLVSLRDGKTKVEQLSIDMSNLVEGRLADKTVDLAAQSDERLANFLSHCRKAK
jgi:hypothetical protein